MSERTICRHCEVDYGRHNSSVCVRTHGSHEWQNVIDTAAELTALRKRVEIFRKQAQHYADQGNWVQSEAWVNTRNLYNFEVNGFDIAAQALAEADKLEESE